MTREPPRLSWSWTVQRRLDQWGYLSVIPILYSILFDPDIDNFFKFPLDDPRYGTTRTRVMVDDDWYIMYAVDDSGNVLIHLMAPRSDIDNVPPWERRRLS